MAKSKEILVIMEASKQLHNDTELGCQGDGSGPPRNK